MLLQVSDFMGPNPVLGLFLEKLADEVFSVGVEAWFEFQGLGLDHLKLIFIRNFTGQKLE